MKIAVVQSKIIFEDKAFNLERARENFKKAAFCGADLICFPEMSFTGFSMNTYKTAETDFYTEGIMAEMCVRYKLAAGFGWVGRNENGLARNHYTVLDSHGEILSDYIKLHPFTPSGEKKLFEKGGGLSTFSLHGVNISTFICYDLRFPEIFQAAARKAELIIVAANWPASRRVHWKTLLKARAIETQSVVAGINCVGIQGKTLYKGGSVVFDAEGNQIYEAGEKETARVIYVPKNTLNVRKQFNVSKDRRLDLYSCLLDEEREHKQN